MVCEKIGIYGALIQTFATIAFDPNLMNKYLILGCLIDLI